MYECNECLKVKYRNRENKEDEDQADWIGLCNMYASEKENAAHMYSILEKVEVYMNITWPHDELWVKQLHSEIKSILYNYVQYSTYVDEDEKEQIP